MYLTAPLHHLICALSNTLDLVGIDDVAHGKRVGLMAAECARVLGWRDEIDFLFDLGLVHDIGVSSTSAHHHLVAEFDWVGSQHHTLVGHDLLASFAPLANMALPVRYHHTSWTDLKATGVDPHVARLANLIYLVDRVDTLASSHYASGGVLQHAGSIRTAIEHRSGTIFNPLLVDAFLEASRTEAFWLRLEPRATQWSVQEHLERASPVTINSAGLLQVATIFARIVDAKSPFTALHSQGVGHLARYFAERLGLGAEASGKLEIAGLLHDLGKLRVPDEILEKPARLDERERQIINAHSFETFQILRHISGLEEVAQWAAWHHEEPGGSGYPFHLQGQDLRIEARILRVADIVQAMVQDRPYRQGLEPAALRTFLRDMVARGKMDEAITAVALDHLDEAFAVARVTAAVRSPVAA